jgi:enamine deaminase RidA (YjgF/YER057c/UK114 family)
LIFTAGQLPLVDGVLTATGKLGAEIDVAEGQRLAEICVLNALAAVHGLVGLDAVLRVVKVVGYVASAPGFTAQPAVLNGASELLGKLFGQAGTHARAAVGVAELPLNAPVELELIVEV